MFLIAEAGVNHNGKLEEALNLVDAAKNCGADAVKFQFFDSRRLWGDDRIRHLDLRFDDFVKLHEHCERTGIEFMCTAFGIAELTMLRPLLKRVKIPSGLNRDPKYLEACAYTDLPILLSTGMCSEEDVRDAVYDGPSCRSLTLLQCTSSYPCRLEEVNLNAMKTLELRFGHLIDGVGLSDHTTSITVPIAAAALGASVIEKHFTLDRNQKGPDHKASITPKEFKAMHIAIIEIEAAMGDGEKRVQPCEEALRKIWAKHG